MRLDHLLSMEIVRHKERRLENGCMSTSRKGRPKVGAKDQDRQKRGAFTASSRRQRDLLLSLVVLFSGFFLNLEMVNRAYEPLNLLQHGLIAQVVRARA